MEQGNVALDDPISDHLPGLIFTQDATRAADITVEQLLTHSSGFVDYANTSVEPGYGDATSLESWVYGPFKDQMFLLSPPGAMYNYNNTGYILAGLIVELKSGVPYHEYMKTHVFAPLGMQRSLWEDWEVMVDNDYSFGTGVQGGSVGPVGGNPLMWPAGGVRTSVEELAKFAQFLRDGDPAVLADQWRLAMRSPQIDEKIAPGFRSYGYGLEIFEWTKIGDEF